MNHWRYRLLTGILFWLVMQVHGEVTACLPNSPAGMFAFHFSAALVDFFLLVSASDLISGRLCGDIQTLCFVSIVVNFLGFIAYQAYVPPVFYNTAMWVLAYVQWARLLLSDRYDLDGLGRNIFRCADSRRA